MEKARLIKESLSKATNFNQRGAAGADASECEVEVECKVEVECEVEVKAPSVYL